MDTYRKLHLKAELFIIIQIRMIIRRDDILNIRCIIKGNKPKSYEIKRARGFTDRITL